MQSNGGNWLETASFNSFLLLFDISSYVYSTKIIVCGSIFAGNIICNRNVRIADTILFYVKKSTVVSHLDRKKINHNKWTTYFYTKRYHGN